MSIDVRGFAVGDVIVHKVPKRDRTVDADAAITFSDAVIPDMNATRRNFFVERVNGSLLERAFDVCPLVGHVSTVPSLIFGTLRDPKRLVATSQDMARALYNAQTKVNNPGLLTVIVGTLGAEPCLAVLKLEHTEGMRMEPIVVEGNQTFSANIFDDLTLTEDARVFKASLFRADGDLSTLEGLASDDQRGAGNGADLANFFLGTFLGCELAAAPDQATRAFYEATSGYLEMLPDPEQRIEYRRALVVALLAPASTLSAPEFSEQYLRNEHKAGYDNYLLQQGVPLTAFDKDTRLIAGKLKQTKLRTRGKLTITGAPEAIEQLVHPEPGVDGRTGRIIIDDELTGVSG
jgi:hypothetical protein